MVNTVQIHQPQKVNCCTLAALFFAEQIQNNPSKFIISNGSSLVNQYNKDFTVIEQSITSYFHHTGNGNGIDVPAGLDMMSTRLQKQLQMQTIPAIKNTRNFKPQKTWRDFVEVLDTIKNFASEYIQENPQVGDDNRAQYLKNIFMNEISGSYFEHFSAFGEKYRTNLFYGSQFQFEDFKKNGGNLIPNGIENQDFSSYFKNTLQTPPAAILLTDSHTVHFGSVVSGNTNTYYVYDSGSGSIKWSNSLDEMLELALNFKHGGHIACTELKNFLSDNNVHAVVNRNKNIEHTEKHSPSNNNSIKNDQNSDSYIQKQYLQYLQYLQYSDFDTLIEQLQLLDRQKYMHIKVSITHLLRAKNQSLVAFLNAWPNVTSKDKESFFGELIKNGFFEITNDLQKIAMSSNKNFDNRNSSKNNIQSVQKIKDIKNKPKEKPKEIAALIAIEQTLSRLKTLCSVQSDEVKTAVAERIAKEDKPESLAVLCAVKSSRVKKAVAERIAKEDKPESLAVLCAVKSSRVKQASANRVAIEQTLSRLKILCLVQSDEVETAIAERIAKEDKPESLAVLCAVKSKSSRVEQAIAKRVAIEQTLSRLKILCLVQSDEVETAIAKRIAKEDKPESLAVLCAVKSSRVKKAVAERIAKEDKPESLAVLCAVKSKSSRVEQAIAKRVANENDLGQLDSICKIPNDQIKAAVATRIADENVTAKLEILCLVQSDEVETAIAKRIAKEDKPESLAVLCAVKSKSSRVEQAIAKRVANENDLGQLDSICKIPNDQIKAAVATRIADENVTAKLEILCLVQSDEVETAIAKRIAKEDKPESLAVLCAVKSSRVKKAVAERIANENDLGQLDSICKIPNDQIKAAVATRIADENVTAKLEILCLVQSDEVETAIAKRIAKEDKPESLAVLCAVKSNRVKQAIANRIDKEKDVKKLENICKIPNDQIKAAVAESITLGTDVNKLKQLVSFQEEKTEKDPIWNKFLKIIEKINDFEGTEKETLYKEIVLLDMYKFWHNYRTATSSEVCNMKQKQPLLTLKENLQKTVTANIINNPELPADTKYQQFGKLILFAIRKAFHCLPALSATLVFFKKDRTWGDIKAGSDMHALGKKANASIADIEINETEATGDNNNKK